MDWFVSVLPVVTPTGALLALGIWVVRQVATGTLVPLITHKQIIDIKDEQLRVTNEARHQAQQSLDKLMETSETSLHLLRSIAPDERAGDRAKFHRDLMGGEESP